MKNQGLKKNTKQLSQEIGEVGVGYVNINKEASNLVLSMPLIRSAGANEIELTLLFNYQNREELSAFGKGVKPSYQKRIEYVNGGLGVVDADGSMETYAYRVGYYYYFNEENQQRLYEEEDEEEGTNYRIEDKYENSLNLYGNTGQTIEVFLANGEKIKYDDNGIDNYKGGVIRYEKSGNLITKVKYLENQVEEAYLLLSYDSTSRLKGIKTYRQGVLLKELEIIYNTDKMIVLDCISKDCVQYLFKEGRVSQIDYGFNQDFTAERSIKIAYENTKTIVTNEQGLSHTYFFTTDLLPIYEKDSAGAILAYEYDNKTKALLSVNSLPLKHSAIFSGNMGGFNKGTGIIVQKQTGSDSDFQEFFEETYRVSGSGEISLTCHEAVLATESIHVVFAGKQNKAYSKDSNVEVVLSAGKETVRKNCFTKTTIDGLPEIGSIGLTCKETCKEYKITFHLYGNASIDFGSIQIYKRNMGAFYEYDAEGNVIQVKSEAGSQEINYDEKNRPSTSVGVDSTSYEYEYDTKGNLTKAKTGFSTRIENRYDSYNHVISQEAFNADKSKIVGTYQSYSEDGKYLMSQIDEFGGHTTYEYDSFGNVKKIINALGTTMEFRYNEEFKGLMKILLNNTTQASYTYDNMRRIKTVQLENESEYEFVYTNQYLTSIKLNGVSIIQYEYDKKTGLIKSQSYNITKKYFFAYNNNKQITTISTNEAVKINVLYRYEYNDKNQLVRVKKGDGSVLNSFEYDEDGKLIASLGSGITTKYRYNQQGQIREKAKLVNDQYINTSYQHLEQARGICPEAIEGIFQNTTKYFGTMFNGTDKLKNKEYVIKPLKSEGFTYSSINHVPCLLLNKVSLLSYVIPLKNAHPLDSNCVGFWFYLSEKTKDSKCLFSLKNANSSCSIMVYKDMQDKLVLELTDKNSNVEEVISSYSCKINDWNFFGLTWMNRNDEGNNDVCEYALFLNDKYHLYKKQNPRLNIYFNSTDPYHIGHHYLSDGMGSLNGFITALMIGAKDYRTIDQMKEYYDETKEYLYASLPTSGTTLYTTKFNKSFDIYPLHNSVLSLKGNKPQAYNVRSFSAKDKNRSFIYDQEIKRFTYKADGKSRLEYKISSTGTILMKAKITKDTSKQCLIECRNDAGEVIGLYRNSSGYLEVQFNQKTYSTNLLFSSQNWHTVGLSFMDDAIYYPSTVGIVKNIRVYLDGKTNPIQEVTNQYSSYAYTVSIGKGFTLHKTGSNLGDTSTYYPLEGQIEMVALRYAYCEVETLNALSEEFKSITKTNEYDELGMLQKISIHKADEEILTNTFTYKTDSEDDAYIYPRVTHQKIQFKAAQADRFYSTDELGNVTTVLDSVFGNHHYEYNARGFLTKEEDTTYSYDDNGNILQAGSKTFEYDQTIKDKLISINGSEITYNGLNPAQWENNVYTFEGRRLTKLEDAVKITGRSKSINYTYDDQGLRTSKVINSAETKYYYDGSQLTTEINSSYRLDYLYDENGLLYGFIKDLTENYYYVRDFMQNILGIVDKEGQLVVKYKYNAWGDHSVTDGNNKVNTSDTFIGNINPMRYKGYYYDKESKMYYCKSRYYVPQWCRWLNADHTAFLDVENINGMNLFSYCQNNPVMGLDPSGHFPWLIIGIVAAILFTPVGGAAVQIAASTISYAGIAIVSIWDKEIRADMNAIHWNPFNKDEDSVLNSSKASFYKGVPVFFVNGLNGSFSFGVIGLDKISHTKNSDVLKHERGHNTQLMMMGLLKYAIFIGIPSPIKNKDNTPWELSASIFGGSSLGQDIASSQDVANAMIYCSCAISNNPILWLINLYYIIKY